MDRIVVSYVRQRGRTYIDVNDVALMMNDYITVVQEGMAQGKKYNAAKLLTLVRDQILDIP